jgi:hypothetical protein
MTWIRALSNVVLLLGLIYGVFVLQPGTVGFGVTGVTRAGVPYEYAKPRDPSVHDGTATIKAGATYLTVKAGGDLARISGSASPDAVPTLSTSAVASGTVAVDVEDPSQHTVVLGLRERTLELSLDESVVWDSVELDVGAVQAGVDLRGLAVKRVRANVGASDLTVTIGDRAKDASVEISGGVANVTLRVPAGAAVTLDSKSGLSNVTVPASFRRLSGVPLLGESSWKSGGSGGPSITITMQSGVSNLTIQTY